MTTNSPWWFLLEHLCLEMVSGVPYEQEPDGGLTIRARTVKAWLFGVRIPVKVSDWLVERCL